MEITLHIPDKLARLLGGTGESSGARSKHRRWKNTGLVI
jgi:hypothetical protein